MEIDLLSTLSKQALKELAVIYLCLHTQGYTFTGKRMQENLMRNWKGLLELHTCGAL